MRYFLPVLPCLALLAALALREAGHLAAERGTTVRMAAALGLGWLGSMAVVAKLAGWNVAGTLQYSAMQWLFVATAAAALAAGLVRAAGGLAAIARGLCVAGLAASFVLVTLGDTIESRSLWTEKEEREATFAALPGESIVFSFYPFLFQLRREGAYQAWVITQTAQSRGSTVSSSSALAMGARVFVEGGVRAARMSAEAGATVAIAEKYRFGGTCVIRGCVPKKLMVYASELFGAFRGRAKGFGWRVGETPNFDWPSLIEPRTRRSRGSREIYARNLDLAGVEIFRAARPSPAPLGAARDPRPRDPRAPHPRRDRGDALRARLPRQPPRDHLERALRSRPRLPERTVIVGGGYIACEFAGILNGLGSAGDAGLSRAADPARLRRRGAATMSRRRCAPRASRS